MCQVKANQVEGPTVCVAFISHGPRHTKYSRLDDPDRPPPPLVPRSTPPKRRRGWLPLSISPKAGPQPERSDRQRRLQRRKLAPCLGRSVTDRCIPVAAQQRAQKVGARLRLHFVAAHMHICRGMGAPEAQLSFLLFQPQLMESFQHFFVHNPDLICRSPDEEDVVSVRQVFDVAPPAKCLGRFPLVPVSNVGNLTPLRCFCQLLMTPLRASSKTRFHKVGDSGAPCWHPR